MSKHVVIVNYNTPELCEAAILSVQKHTPGCTFHMLDNSDRMPFSTYMPGLDYVDNTRGQLCNWHEWVHSFPDRIESPVNDYGSAKHCFSIELMLQRLDTDCVLIDSDILLTRDISELWDDRYMFAAEVKTNTTSWGFRVFRAKPILCYVNVPKMRRLGISYFNGERMWDMSSKMPCNRYDTGAWFFEQVEHRRLPYRKINIGDYALHLGHASYKTKPWQQWLDENKDLWQ